MKIKISKPKMKKQEKIGEVTPKQRSPLTRSAKKSNTTASTSKKKDTVHVTTYKEATDGLDLHLVRQWARKKKYTVGDRGRIPISILLEYREKH